MYKNIYKAIDSHERVKSRDSRPVDQVLSFLWSCPNAVDNAVSNAHRAGGRLLQTEGPETAQLRDLKCRCFRRGRGQMAACTVMVNGHSDGQCTSTSSNHTCPGGLPVGVAGGVWGSKTPNLKINTL